MSFVTIEVPPEVAPSSHSLLLNTPFTPRHLHQGFYKDFLQRFFTKTFYKDMGLEHIRPFLDAIMQLKPANTGILLRDNGVAD